MGFFGKIKKVAKKTAKTAVSTAKTATKITKTVASNSLIKSMVKTGLALTPAGQAVLMAQKFGGDKLLKGALKGDIKGGLKAAAKQAIKSNLGVKLDDAKKIFSRKKDVKADTSKIIEALPVDNSSREVSHIPSRSPVKNPIIVEPITDPMVVPEEYKPVVIDREISNVQIPTKPNMTEVTQLILSSLGESISDSARGKIVKSAQIGDLFGW